jgi:hypothetical protein
VLLQSSLDVRSVDPVERDSDRSPHRVRAGSLSQSVPAGKGAFLRVLTALPLCLFPVLCAKNLAKKDFFSKYRTGVGQTHFLLTQTASPPTAHAPLPPQGTAGHRRTPLCAARLAWPFVLHGCISYNCQSTLASKVTRSEPHSDRNSQ